MKKFNSFFEAEKRILKDIINNSDFETSETLEKVNYNFCIKNPSFNKNKRSNYEYANEFFNWILSSKIKELNPFAEKFIDSSNLPNNFSSSYGWKIKDQFEIITNELINNNETRRAYFNVLLKQDNIILNKETNHEYPCTIGIQFLIRENKLNCIVNMRSNNAFSVLPYKITNILI